MLILFLFSIKFKLCNSRGLFACNETSCNPNWLGDGYCNLECNNQVCNFDSSDTLDKKPIEIFAKSDCYWSCIQKGCNTTLLGNNKCDPSCNNNECGYDLGDCGSCASGCFNNNLTNNKCDPKCNNTNCMFDNDACGWCSFGCYLENLTASTCVKNCNVSNCLLISSNPCITPCAPGCFPSMQGNNICDDECNNVQCGYDSGDCLCNTGCFPDLLYDPKCYTNSTYKDPCDNYWCNYKNGACKGCADGCMFTMLGNGVCDDACNNQQCEFDYGDCGCAVGCNSRYDNVTDTWTWDNDTTHFQNCLVPSCFYNYRSSNFNTNQFLVREIILAQIIFTNWSLTTLPQNSKCSNSSLQNFDSGEYCEQDDPCNTPSGLYCVGMPGPGLSNCLRSDGSHCIVCEGFMIMSVCVSGITSCPTGYSSTPNVGQVFDELSSLTWCLRNPTFYSPLYYQEIYVSPSDYPGNSTGSGTDDDPFFSIYYAFTKVFAAYTKIILSDGYHHYEKINTPQPIPLVTDKLDPLNINSFLNFYELWIIGEDPTNRPTVYWHGLLKISTLAKKLFIKNIVFQGTQILAMDCASETNPDYCFYCPYLVTKDGYTLDQNSNILQGNESSMIPQNCSLYNSEILFSLNDAGFFENVDFEGFRQQFNTLILATGSLNLTNVNFDNIQPSAGGNVISMKCTSNCGAADFLYNSGSVSNLNSGYQLFNVLELGSFFSASSVNSLSFNSVNFTFNLVLSYLGSANAANLISSTNQLGTVTISDCIFDTNYVDSLILVDVTSLVYNDLQPNYLGYSVSYSQIHFNITNSIIQNIYASTDLISYKMGKTVHNININNLTISNVAVGENGIIYISNTGTLKNKDTQGSNQFILYRGQIMSVFIPPRYVNISNLVIENCSTGNRALEVKNMPWVTVENIKIHHISDNMLSNTDIIDLFANNDYYFTAYPDQSQVPSLSCFDITLFSSVYNVQMTDIEVYTTSCLSNLGTSGINIITVTNQIEIDSVKVHDIDSQTSSGLALSITSGNVIVMTNLSINRVYNTDGCVVQILDPISLNIEFVSIQNSMSSTLSPVCINQVLTLTLDNFEISNCQSISGNGGCLNVIASRISDCYASITNGNFSNCEAPTGYGGAFVLDGIASKNSWNFHATNISISNSNAMDGGAIYITSQCSFIQNSSFANLNILNNYAMLSIVSDNHSFGQLLFETALFSNNQANIAAISGLYKIYPGSSASNDFLYVYDTEVYNCEGSSMFSIVSQNTLSEIYFKNVNIHDDYSSDSKVVAIVLTKLTFVGTEISVFNLDSAFSVNSASIINVSWSYFYNLGSYFYNAINGVVFWCDFCEVFQVSDSLITANSNSSVTLTNSKFYSNFITGGSTALINIFSHATYKNLIKNCIFSNNYAMISDLFSFTSTSITIIDSKFQNNSSPNVLYNGFYLYQSNLSISNCAFSDQYSSYYAGFMYINTKSNVEIDFTSFSKGYALFGGAIFIQDSTLLINSSLFNSNYAKNAGGSIYSSKSLIKIINSTFTNGISEFGESIYVDSNSLSIYSSTFKYSASPSDLRTSSIYVTGLTSLIIDSSQFVSPSNQISALIVIGSNSVHISNSQFINYLPISVGSTNFIGNNVNGSVIISNSEFKNNNSTGSGGAIYLSDMTLNLVDSTISHNYAGIDGGGLYLQSPLCNTCTFTISRTLISYNTCMRNGGAMAWFDFKPSIDDSSIILNNSASYGSDFSSKPASMKIASSRMLFSSVFTLSNIAPGQTIKAYLLISLVDTYGNVITTDSSSVLRIQTIPNFPDLALIGDTSFIANKGVFNITNFIANAPPGSIQFFNASTSSISSSNVRNDNTSYENSIEIEIVLRNCSLGEQIGLTSCEICPASKYLIEPGFQCLSCPTGAKCLGGFQVLPQFGYWRSSNMSSIVYACPTASACLGNSSLTDYQGTCAQGYYGAKCGACLGGYTLSSKGVCDFCPSPVQNGFILAILIIAIIVVCIIIVDSSKKAAFEKDAIVSVYLKIFTNYVQLVFLTSQFNLEWSNYVSNLFSANKQVAESSDSIFSVDCYVATKHSGDPADSYFYKLILFSFLPIISTFLSFLFWLAISYYKKRKIYLKRELPLTVIVLFFLFYPNITKFMFSHFACEYIDLLGDYLMANYAIKCWDSTHSKYSLIVALPSIIIWIIGSPLIVMIIMVKRRKVLYSETDNKIIFGFLFNGYSSSKYFWEFVIIFRKVLMICIAVFALQIIRIMQGLVIVLVLIFSVFIQYKFKPFNLQELNFLELEALMAATITLYCGLFFLTDSIDGIFAFFLFLIILFGNIYFVLMWVYWIFIALIDILVDYFPEIKYFAKKGDCFKEDFYIDDIQKEGIRYNNEEGKKIYTFLARDKKNFIDFKERNMEKLYKRYLRYDDDDKNNEEDSELFNHEEPNSFIPLSVRDINSFRTRENDDETTYEHFSTENQEKSRISSVKTIKTQRSKDLINKNFLKSRKIVPYTETSQNYFDGDLSFKDLDQNEVINDHLVTSPVDSLHKSSEEEEKYSKQKSDTQNKTRFDFNEKIIEDRVSINLTQRNFQMNPSDAVIKEELNESNLYSGRNSKYQDDQSL